MSTPHREPWPVSYGSYVRGCRCEGCRAAQRAYYEANRDQIAGKQRAYREANREQIAEKQRAYREAVKRAERQVHPRESTSAMFEDAAWLLSEGDAALTEACARLGVTPRTFHQACRRHDRMDLYWRLADREPDAERRRASKRRDGAG